MRSTRQGLGDDAGGSRVALYAAIRRDARAGMSNRALQRKHGVGYRTVTAALNSAWPEPRKAPPKRDLDEKAFRWMLNEDAMATEKLSEGIRAFAKDLGSLRTMIDKELKAAA